jgi:hypothetical protein
MSSIVAALWHETWMTCPTTYLHSINIGAQKTNINCATQNIQSIQSLQDIHDFILWYSYFILERKQQTAWFGATRRKTTTGVTKMAGKRSTLAHWASLMHWEHCHHQKNLKLLLSPYLRLWLIPTSLSLVGSFDCSLYFYFFILQHILTFLLYQSILEIFTQPWNFSTRLYLPIKDFLSLHSTKTTVAIH